MQYNALINAARAARARAYAPYSGFKVDAALATTSGEVFTGCNIENLSFGLTVCAERSAVAVAISNGNRDFATLAIVTDYSELPLPCGACGQVLSESNPNLKIVADCQRPNAGIRVGKTFPSAKQRGFGGNASCLNYPPFTT